MFDAGVLFGFFGVVPAIEGADEVAGDTAQTFEFAFVEVFGVGVEVFFGGFSAGFVGDEPSTDFYQAGNVQSVIVFEIGESIFDFFFGNFGVFV